MAAPLRLLIPSQSLLPYKYRLQQQPLLVDKATEPPAPQAMVVPELLPTLLARVLPMVAMYRGLHRVATALRLPTPTAVQLLQALIYRTQAHQVLR